MATLRPTWDNIDILAQRTSTMMIKVLVVWLLRYFRHIQMNPGWYERAAEITVNTQERFESKFLSSFSFHKGVSPLTFCY